MVVIVGTLSRNLRMRPTPYEPLRQRPLLQEDVTALKVRLLDIKKCRSHAPCQVQGSECPTGLWISQVEIKPTEVVSGVIASQSEMRGVHGVSASLLTAL